MRKPIIIGLVTTATVSGLVVGGMFMKKGSAAFDWLGLNQKIQQHDEQLANHEARITNTESDVADVQTNTSTPPSNNRQSVPSVTTPEPQAADSPAPATQPAPAPTPVTVKSYDQVGVEDTENMDCKLTYSDDTTYIFRWKTVTYNQSTKITSMNGKCDTSVVGKEKTITTTGYAG